ncbi:MFS transporter [Spirosoma foliorum]|uniref:MFS transporter n=1 Tax=Spirosoma foliorum TaxID=2710596 RepID=A0A7G5H4B0_9BACT|nr:MFS transporter [Spirosoma foliorum]QMW05952.1 MFS transporter [Spirosoma foliorum]
MEKTEINFGFVVGTTSLAFVVSQLDVSIVNVALPQIGKSLTADVSTLQWIIDSYTIAFAVLMLSAGGMSDLFGSKRLFQAGLLVFGVASIGCGLAWSSLALIGFRAVQGMGSAIMIPSSLSILNHTFSEEPKQRARAVALWTAAGGVSIAAGPVLGGLLMQLSSWRMIFLVNIPICLIGILCSTKLMESTKNGKSGFDIPGQLIWMFAITALIASIIEWHHLGLKSPLIYGGIIVSAILFVLFIWREKMAKSPILPLDLFNSTNFNVLIGVGVLFNCTYYGTVFILSLYLQNVLGYSSLTAGMAFLPLTAGFIISNLTSGKLMQTYGIRVPILVGLLVFSIGCGLLLVAKPITPYWQLLFPFLALPLGMGLAVPAMTTGTLATVDRSRSGIASAVLNTTRQTAGAIGVAVFGAMATGGPAAIVQAIITSSISSAVCVLLYTCFVFKYLKNN